MESSDERSSDERPGISEIIPQTESISCTGKIDRLGMPLSGDLSPQTHSKETETIENIISTLFWLHSHPKVKNFIPQSSSSNNRTGNNSGSSDDDNLFVRYQINKLQIGLNQIKEAFDKLYFEDGDSELFQNFVRGLDDISNIITQAYPLPTDQDQKSKLSAFKNNVLKLKFKFRYLLSKSSCTISDSVPNELPVDRYNKFQGTSAFDGYEEAFNDLDIKSKLCLLSFAELPVNVVLKRRLLIHWWFGEGNLDCLATGEETADQILNELRIKGFIERVKERLTDGFKMQPFMYHTVITLAQKAKLLHHCFDGISVTNYSLFNRACLMKDADRTLMENSDSSPSFDQEKLQTIFNVNDPSFDQEKLRTIFNVNDPHPDLRSERFAKTRKTNTVEWFSGMKNVNVLCLGRWQSSGGHHIEVQSTEFLKGLKNMKGLRFLSLQGISSINKLPDSIGMLTNLRILDLKACHDLEALPGAIVSLKKLLHLDISKCYLLDWMPKGLASLSNLRVLKGFVINNLKSRSSCTLEDLVELKKLTKLSINTSCKDFPTEEELRVLKKFKALQKLAIAWYFSEAAKPTGAPRQQTRTSWCFYKKRDSPLQETREDRDPLELPTGLVKLELQSFPYTRTPSWLIPGKLQNLKKLYIRGGKLNNLRQMQENNDKWTVEILRMKYLEEFNMDWNELQTLFPKLKFLENFKCPNLTSYPCDDFGVWQTD